MQRRLRQRDTLFYGIADFAMAMLAWAMFFLYRKTLEGAALTAEVFQDPNFYLGVLIVPVGWVLLYGIFDQHTDIYRMSRLTTLTQTFFLSFLGVTFLFFSQPTI